VFLTAVTYKVLKVRQYRRCTYNVRVRCVRVTIVAVEKK